MFGYVRPVKDELKVKELEAYRGAYCGLCHAMGRKYGFWSRFTLNYDFTLLAMLFSSEAEGHQTCPRRCPVHPFRKKRACLCHPGLDAAADQSIILTWQKLRDDCLDKSFWKGLPSRLAAWLLRGAYRKAVKAQPEFDREVTRCLEQLHRLEQERSPSIDRTADTFARILKAAVPPQWEEERRRALEQCLYHVGRWIYLVDAWDDLKEDRETGAYNPLEVRFAGNPEAELETVRITMTHSVKLAISAYHLLPVGNWSPIVENILYLGLPGVQEAVFSGKWRGMQKDIGR